MKIKVLPVSVLIFALLLSGCGAIGGGNNSSTSSGTMNSLGPLNTGYSNALPIPEQLIIGTFKLDKTSNAVNTQQATQLITYWEAYQSISTSTAPSQQELDAIVTQIEQTMTPAQVQAIADMKLTRQDMQTVFQSQGIAFGGAPRGNGTPSANNGQGGNRGGGGGFFGGGGGGDGFRGGGFGGGGGFGNGQATPDAQAIATLQARRANSGANRFLVEAVVRYLQTKAGIATATFPARPTRPATTTTPAPQTPAAPTDQAAVTPTP